MMDKFTNILEQYGREVDRVTDIFRAHRAAPPCSKQQPPVAGAIVWARSLYHRIKKSIIRFQGHGSLLTTDKGKEICKQYIAIAREITQYEERLFGEWEQSVRRTIDEKLKQFILSRTVIATTTTVAAAAAGSSGKDESSAAASGAHSNDASVSQVGRSDETAMATQL
jgi:dynein heavy chain